MYACLSVSRSFSVSLDRKSTRLHYRPERSRHHSPEVRLRREGLPPRHPAAGRADVHGGADLVLQGRVPDRLQGGHCGQPGRGDPAGPAAEDLASVAVVYVHTTYIAYVIHVYYILTLKYIMHDEMSSSTIISLIKGNNCHIHMYYI